MTRFWATAAAHWPLSLPRRRLEAAIGAEDVAALVGSGILTEAPLRASETLPCATCRRPARLVAEPEGLVAVCSGDADCPWEAFGLEETRLRVQPVRVFDALARALALEGVPGTEALATPLGRRTLGDEQVAFDFVARPTLEGVEDALHRLVRGGPRVRVLLVPCAARLPATAPAELAGIDLVWVGLDELLVVGAPMSVDWRALLAHRTFAGFSPSVSFTGLTIGPDGVWWGGRRVEKQPTPLATQLLRILAARPGVNITHAKLWLALWPEKHTRAGRIAKGESPDGFNHGVRTLVAELRERLGKEVIVNERGGAQKGGYSLGLQPEMVRLR